MLSATTEQTKKNPKKDFEKKGSKKKGFAVIRAGWLGWFETFFFFFFFFKSAVPLLLSAKLGFDKWGRTLR